MLPLGLSPGSVPRVCAVSYLNTLPLVWGLLRDPRLQRHHNLTFELPAVCAHLLATGAADIGIVPAIELIRQPLEALPGVGIAAHGAVRSILLVSRVPIAAIQTLAVDSSSRTSVALARIILEERYGVSPIQISLRPRLEEMLTQADAALVIGDPALRLEPKAIPYRVLDLSEEWLALTGLPMVFAVWAARPGFASAEAAQTFVDSYTYGREHVEEIVREKSAEFRVEPELAREYLTRYIRYEIGPRENEGLRRFLELAAVRENKSEAAVVQL